ncbi:hypothetical protein A2118_02110, partial [Candidatus Kaiserbacteria bacterium GWA2_50_9]
MASIKDDRGYNQGFAPATSTTVRMSRRTDLLLSEMNLTQDTRILELGCGTGEVSYWMAQRSPAQVLGTDLCIPFIEEAKKKYQLPNLRYEVTDFNDPRALVGMQFDYIVGNGILHHLYPNLDAVFARMRRLLKENGKIIFLEPNFYNPYVYLIFSFPTFRALAKLEPSEMAFSKRFITDALSWAGFKDIRVDYKDFLLPGIPSFLVQPSIMIGTVLEKLPLFKQAAQSLFIRAYHSSGVAPPPREDSIHREKFRLITRYGISGATAAAIQIVGLYIWVSVLGLTRQYLLGVVIAYCVALFVAFIMQKYWTFRDYSRDLIVKQVFWYTAISLGNLGLNALILHTSKVVLESNGLNFFQVWYLVAQIFAV